MGASPISPPQVSLAASASLPIAFEKLPFEPLPRRFINRGVSQPGQITAQEVVDSPPESTRQSHVLMRGRRSCQQSAVQVDIDLLALTIHAIDRVLFCALHDMRNQIAGHAHRTKLVPGVPVDSVTEFAAADSIERRVVGISDSIRLTDMTGHLLSCS